MEKYVSHDAPEIAETCKIAIDLISWKQRNEEVGRSVFLSVDPAPAIANKMSINELKNILNDSSLPLFERYRAMFSLRNMNSDASAIALLSGFSDSSALFRHEIAYVLGQMERSVTVPGLRDVLLNINEHPMVRHEAAEALGAIGGQDVCNTLSNFSSDSVQIVSDSCVVALDTMEYWDNFSGSS